MKMSIMMSSSSRCTIFLSILILLSRYQPHRNVERHHIFFVAAQDGTSCPADYNLTKFNNPQPSQTATFLDVDFTCIYNDFADDGITYQFVPAPFVRVEPGDEVAFYSYPPDIYDIIDRDDGSTVSLAHNRFTEQPNETLLVITWPATQLERLRVGTINGTLLLAEGFTNLRELNVTGQRGGLEAYLSTEGTIQMRLTGANLFGKHVQASSNTQLDVYIEIGEGNVDVVTEAENSIVGEVHAVRNVRRTGNVSLDGIQSIVSTGLGPGRLFVDDCSKVDGDNCEMLEGSLPTPDTSCRLTPTCLVTAFTTSLPVRTCTGQFPEGGVFTTCDDGNGDSGVTSERRCSFHLHMMSTLLILSWFLIS